MPPIRSPDRRKRALGAAMAVVLAPAWFPPGASGATLSHAVTNYLTHCGGCHGIEGASGPTHIPTLRGEVGRFTCTSAGRAYLVGVPGVSMSLIRNDQDLADVLNFVVFTLGGASTPPGTRPYTAPEVHALRARPITTANLQDIRTRTLTDAIAHCPD